MLHLVITAELRVFILERVVTMWARRHNLLHPSAGKRLDICLGKLLKEEFITDTPGGLKLQCEGSDIRFRNTWIKELDLKDAETDFKE